MFHPPRDVGLVERATKVDVPEGEHTCDKITAVGTGTFFRAAAVIAIDGNGNWHLS